MAWLVAIIVGGVAGWLASMIMRRDASMGLVLNVIVGIIGAYIGNKLAGWLFGMHGSISSFNLLGLVVATGGAVVLLGIVNLVQRGRMR